MGDFDLTYLSLGAGVQSTALLIAAVRGLYGVPRPDLVLFADTGEEAPWTYEALDLLDSWSPIPITRLTPKHGIAAHPRLDIPPPAFVSETGKGRGQLRRQCTKEYKILPIERAVRSALGYKKGQQVKRFALSIQGISWDERQRAKMSRTRWIINDYPLIDLEMTREDCRRIIREEGLPVPGKSSCIICPYHDDGYWRALRDSYPVIWERACAYDDRIRHSPPLRGECYLHRSLRPLREAPLGIAASMDLWEGASVQVCEGMCGV